MFSCGGIRGCSIFSGICRIILVESHRGCSIFCGICRVILGEYHRGCSILSGICHIIVVESHRGCSIVSGEIRHPMSLGHPVATHTHDTRILHANDCISHYSFLHHLGLYGSYYTYHVYITFPVHCIHHSSIVLYTYVSYYAYNVYITFPLH